MSVQIKFCGLTRSEDVHEAERLCATYLGAIFAGGPRVQTCESASQLFANRSAAARVGVWGTCDDLSALQRMIDTVPLDVVQLHADPTPAEVDAVRSVLPRDRDVKIWAVVRIGDDGIVPSNTRMLFDVADAVVFDTRVPSGLGGTGRSFKWDAVANAVEPYRSLAAVVLAGGLTEYNVADAIREFRPDIVDVSSGVESAPGVKDHQRMQAFAAAVRGCRL